MLFNFKRGYKYEDLQVLRKRFFEEMKKHSIEELQALLLQKQLDRTCIICEGEDEINKPEDVLNVLGLLETQYILDYLIARDVEPLAYYEMQDDAVFYLITANDYKSYGFYAYRYVGCLIAHFIEVSNKELQDYTQLYPKVGFDGSLKKLLSQLRERGN